MKKFLLWFLALAPAFALPPDCNYAFRLSNRVGDKADNINVFTLSGGAAATIGIDNRGQGCTGWQLMTSVEGLSAISVQLEDSATTYTTTGGAPSQWIAFQGSVVSGSNPSTATTVSTYVATGYYPWIRVNVASSTGTGAVDILLYGYKTVSTLTGTIGGVINRSNVWGAFTQDFRATTVLTSGLTDSGTITAGTGGANGCFRVGSSGGNSVSFCGAATQQGGTINPNLWLNAGTFSIPVNLSTQTSSTDLLDAAVINTTETVFATSYTFPASFFTNSPKTNVRVRCAFEETTSAAAVTQRIRVRFGGLAGTVMYDSTAVAPGNSLVTRSIATEFTFIGTAAPGASVPIEVTFGSTPPTPTTPFSVANTIASPVSIATNASQQLVVTMTYSGNTAGNTVRLRIMSVDAWQ